MIRAWWTSLLAELLAVRPRPGEHLRLLRLEDDAEGRRCFLVQRIAADAEDPQP